MSPATAPTTPATTPLNVLLWAPPGVGLHYSGPGMTAFRMYSRARPGLFDLSLVHGRPDQAQHDLFRRQEFLAPTAYNMVAQARLTRAGVRWMRRHVDQYDVVHGLQGFHATVLPCVEAIRRGVPAIVKLAAFGVELTDKGGLKGLFGAPRKRRRLIRELSGIIAISRAIREELLEIGIPESQIARIPNGVDTQQFFPPADDAERRRQRATLGWRDVPTVVFVGGVVDRKRPHLLVEAAGLLRRSGLDDFQIVLAGPEQDEAYTAAMRSRARELDVTDHIVWAGFSPDPSPFYRASDVFALPSGNEGLPNAMLEAMASGLPAIGTRISGITDLIEEERTGRLVEPDARSIADAASPFLRDVETARTMGAAALELIRERYSVEAVLAAHETLFRRAIAGEDAEGASILPA